MASKEKVVVTGASGLVGSALVPALRAHGFEVIRLVRRGTDAPDEVRWDPSKGTIDAEGLEGISGAVHLAGENVASDRWTEEKKSRIRESRVQGTELLAKTLAELTPKPRFLISASAVGYYGDRGAEPLDEHAGPGSGFLASVCEQWEAATRSAGESGIRVVHARIGIVLAAEGGALAKMKTPFLLGVGGRIGDGSQYMSWITLEDLVSAFVFAALRDGLRGPVNFVSPDPVRNDTFTDCLGKVLRRPTVFPVPKFAIRLAMGSEMANEMLLASARVIPTALQSEGFAWNHTTLRPALESVL